MGSNLVETGSDANLRLRALQRLTGTNGSHGTRLNPSAAFRVLYDLASSASGSAAALALLHELQVHQVELDLQDEELRRSRAELEATLDRQLQLYNFAPVGCFTVDRHTALRELNLTAARMLGAERGQLLGRTLDSFLAPQSARALHAMLARVCDGAPTEVDALQLAAERGTARSVRASASRDPDGRQFLIAFIDVAE
ncbi:MAG: PAS domain-containing protein [Steroidobacteraceae bacterium]|jgi:PAS domain S-box-containing protein